MKLKGFIAGCLSAATYGLIPLFALPLLKEGFNYDSILFYRFLFSAIILALILLFTKESFTIDKKVILPLIALGILYALSAQFLFSSYQHLSVGMASTLLFLYPIFVAILMALLFKERISWISQVAIGIAFIGILFLHKDSSSEQFSIIGFILILSSSLSYALYMITVNKSGIQNLSGYKLTFYVLLISAVFFLAKALLNGGIQPLAHTNSIFNVFLLALLPTVISCVAIVFSIRYIGSTTTAVMGALEPVTAVGIGVFIFHETLTLNLITGITFIIFAVTLIILSDHIKNKFNFRKRTRTQKHG